MKILIWLLSLIPAIGSLTVINRVEPYILGLPFIVFWATAWLILTSVCLYISSMIHDKKEVNK
ncbi:MULTISPECIES: DUF3311 domain-containing protein [Aneurinibacillus]|uniref:DUF3311 domain-containing protein n=1 Tax=Aneurinibacillus thermoaerophilus TaxID=143495 RepID=A0A1G7YEM8_ANETH|nr:MULTISPECIES: DUF3311 domain-containing protein [Aneurinibacillus]AMA72221.1 hypothetical protein ACH33_04685 [Aneurinibacillus sp. XH2]MED0676507.1 DUF3311 domain-containing protein [Aneurinibacillus thermoaerophilus]MED0679019.1 DUF3311 domain-containing protein [Aneurinibacillus thermoaerophilus]MED0736556.1 DUF3311 domain-containing protein [Aneurinibacillus thermoaerophilus]MED0756060.1 DUF3311 domain-containing protein [Aneurinibacillus thermoaerophilus]